MAAFIGETETIKSGRRSRLLTLKIVDCINFPVQESVDSVRLLILNFPVYKTVLSYEVANC